MKTADRTANHENVCFITSSDEEKGLSPIPFSVAGEPLSVTLDHMRR